MTQIDSIAQLAALIRRQVARARVPARTARRSATTKARAHEPGHSGAVHVAEEGDIANLIARRVRSIDPADPQRERKAFRMFLESVLLAELGEQLMNDAGFYQLVEQVHTQMEADAELATAIKEAAGLLLVPRG